MKRYDGKIVSFLIIMILVFSLCVPFSAAAAGNARRVVTVAFTGSTNFMEEDSSGQKSGLAYDYLQRISYFTNWEYRYVYGDPKDLLEMFYKGEIDLYPGLQKSESPDGKALFSEYPMGTTNYYIYVHSDDPIAPTKEERLRNVTIGVNRDTPQEEFLRRWNRQGDYSAKILTYADSEKRMDAFESYETSATVATDYSVNSEMNMVPIAWVGGADYFLAVSSERGDLLGELNRAQSTITSIDPMFLKRLTDEYLRGNSVSMFLSREEDVYIYNHPKLRIGYYDNYLPFSGQDAAGNASGILTDVIDRMLLELRINKRVSVEYTSYPSTEEMVEALRNGEIDIAFPVEVNLAQAERDGIALVSELMRTPMFLVFSGTYDESVTQKIAVTKGNRFQENMTKRSFPDAEIVYSTGLEDALHKVETGEAGSVVVNEMRKDGYLKTVRFRNLKAVPLPSERTMCMAVNRGNTVLLTILERGNTQIPANFAMTSTYSYLSEMTQFRMEDYLYDHMYLVFIGFLLITLILIGGPTFMYMNVRKRRELDRMAHIDNMTGLRNRRSFDEAFRERVSNPVHEDFLFLTADLNELKRVNDTFGHEAGDELIISAAEILKETFAPYGEVYRVGGDEFVMMGDIPRAEREGVLKLLRSKNDSWKGSSGQHLSMSLGYAARDEVPHHGVAELRKEADQRMYDQKALYYQETGHNRRGIRPADK